MSNNGGIGSLPTLSIELTMITKSNFPRTTHPSRTLRKQRGGVTLMECIFAIGVVLTGLVGLAALIPVASQNARDTIEIDRSISESTSASATGVVQSFHDLDSLVIMDKPVQGSSQYFNGGYIPTNAMETIQSKLDQEAYNGSVWIPVGKLESPGYVHMPWGSGLSSGICIDPFGIPDLALLKSPVSDPRDYVIDPSLDRPFLPPAATDSAFDFSRFPYFNERYDVLAPPNAQVGNPVAVNGAINTRPWPMGPRMYRATLKSPMFDSTPLVRNAGLNTSLAPMRRFQLLSPAISQSIFTGTGGLSGVDGIDKDSPRGVLVDTTLVGTNLIDGRRDGSSDYTWFATMTPSYLGGDSFRQSVVVVRKRLSPVPIRSGDPLGLSKAESTIDDFDDNPTSERVTWIDPQTAIGFSGGSGGEVTLYGSKAVSTKIATNSWVMLSRQPHRYGVGPPVVLIADGPAVHRWYRVISVGEAQYTNNFSWQGSTPDVWERRLALAGPDWAFQDEPNTGNSSPIDDTFCTIVEGAVSVIESEIKFE